MVTDGASIELGLCISTASHHSCCWSDLHLLVLLICVIGVHHGSNAGHDGSAAKCPTDTGHFELIDSLIATIWTCPNLC